MTNVEHITRALKGRWHGHYGVAFCPAHSNTRTAALSPANGEDGRLLARCHAGCSFAAILDALHALGPAAGTATHIPVIAAILASECTMASKQPFPETGLVHLSAPLAPNGPIPVSKSSRWVGVRCGRFPKSVKLGPRTTVWNAEDICALVEGPADSTAVIVEAAE